MSSDFKFNKGGFDKLKRDVEKRLPKIIEEACAATFATHAGKPQPEVAADLARQFKKRGLEMNASSDNIQKLSQGISDGKKPVPGSFTWT